MTGLISKIMWVAVSITSMALGVAEFFGTDYALAAVTLFVSALAADKVRLK